MKVNLAATNSEHKTQKTEIINIPFKTLWSKKALKNFIETEFAWLKPKYPKISRIHLWISKSLIIQLLNTTFKKERGGYSYVWRPRI